MTKLSWGEAQRNAKAFLCFKYGCLWWSSFNWTQWVWELWTTASSSWVFTTWNCSPTEISHRDWLTPLPCAGPNEHTEIPGCGLGALCEGVPCPPDPSFCAWLLFLQCAISSSPCCPSRVSRTMHAIHDTRHLCRKIIYIMVPTALIPVEWELGQEI